MSMSAPRIPRSEQRLLRSHLSSSRRGGRGKREQENENFEEQQHQENLDGNSASKRRVRSRSRTRTRVSLVNNNQNPGTALVNLDQQNLQNQEALRRYYQQLDRMQNPSPYPRIVFHFAEKVEGPWRSLWLAAHWEKRLKKTDYMQADVNEIVDDILQTRSELTLRQHGHLLLGATRVLARKVTYQEQQLAAFADQIQASLEEPEEEILDDLAQDPDAITLNVGGGAGGRGNWLRDDFEFVEQQAKWEEITLAVSPLQKRRKLVPQTPDELMKEVSDGFGPATPQEIASFIFLQNSAA
ncbi:unnamed protein product, partial [Amoebophrya sp. A120]|eukprot:GSA120T00017233001.1